MKKDRLSKFYLIVVSLSFAFVLILFAVFNFHLSFREAEIKNTQALLKNEAKSSAQRIKDNFSSMSDSLEDLADTLEPSFMNKSDIQRNLSFVSKFMRFDFIGVADANGITMDSNAQSTDISHRKYFQESMQGRNFISEVMESAITKDQVVQIMSVPIRQGQEITGVCFGVFNIETLSSEIEFHENNGAYLQIVDSEGNYITQEDKEDALTRHENIWDEMKSYELQDQSLETVRENIKNKKSGFFRLKYKEEERVSYYQPLGIGNWYIFSTINQESINSQVSHTTKLMYRMLVPVFVAFILIFLTFLYLSKRAKDIAAKAYLETKKNEEMLYIALEESKNSLFEYKQREKKVILRGNITDAFHIRELNNMPDSCMEYGIVSPGSYEDCRALFEEIKTKDSATKDLKLMIENRECWHRVIMKNIYDERHVLINTIGIIENIDEQMLQKIELEENERIQAKLISNALFICMIDLNTGNIKEKDGIKPEKELKYKDYLRDEIVPRIMEDNRAQILSCMSVSNLLNEHKTGNDTKECIFRMLVDETQLWVSCTYHIIENKEQNELYALMLINDINEKKSREIELQRQAERDGLTNLYNAAALKSKVNAYLQSVQALDGYQIFILMDLDNFKAINDTFGHAYGDRVLKDVSGILAGKFRRNDIVARLGGDEFVVMLLNVRNKDGIHRIYEELVKDLYLTYTENGVSITVSVSLGVSIAPGHGNDFQTLYKKADEALYEAKKQNKNGYCIYER